tara:strand:- start:710 stop:2446 length:1737 start_codon:yes stop_codon:yes gene_type:complete
LSNLAIVRRNVPVGSDLPSDYHPVVKRVLASRGVLTLAELDVSLEGLHKPDLLSGIDGAVALLECALVTKKRILVVADYDADGATSCAVAIRALKAMGAHQVSYIVPNRFEYGYGLTPPIVELAAAHNPDLLVTVDNGISSIDGVSAARRRGIDVLITDHHLPGREMPPANSIVNPNLPGDPFPSKALAGVGVIFYVMLALRKQLRRKNWFSDQGIAVPNLASLLDLVALGTVADVVPLDQNNRRLVVQGLIRIRAGRAQPGIDALLRVAGREANRLRSLDLAFAVAPRLNAAGRLADMSLGIECLICDNAIECNQNAIALDNLNRERREIEAEMKVQALAKIDDLGLSDEAALPHGLCLHDELWHQGVVGIIASRLKERYHRPVIAFANLDNGQLKGSGRSIPGVHLRDALDAVAAQNPQLLERFGGHAMAAGLTLPASKLEQFKTAFDSEIKRQLGGVGIRLEVLTDGAIDAEDFNLDLAEQLADVAPWGQKFPEPLFDGSFAILQKSIVSETHLRMKLQPLGEPVTIDAIAFGAAKQSWAQSTDVIHATYRLSVNEYRGTRSLQAIVEYAYAIDG